MNERIAALKRMGFKLTPQRMAIVGYLEGNESHPAALDIHRALLPEYPSLSLATVYNTLETLVKAGLLRELSVARDKSNYDPDTSSHSHAYCTRCGRIFDVRDSGVNANTGIPGFTVTDVRTVFYGICGDCASGPLPK
jgi:Fur family transcriptional regulator, peroxide stress response regulator